MYNNCQIIRRKETNGQLDERSSDWHIPYKSPRLKFWYFLRAVEAQPTLFTTSRFAYLRANRTLIGFITKDTIISAFVARLPPILWRWRILRWGRRHGQVMEALSYIILHNATRELGRGFTLWSNLSQNEGCLELRRIKGMTYISSSFGFSRRPLACVNTLKYRPLCKTTTWVLL